VYIDDDIVFSKTFDQHVEGLSTVFQRLCSAGLKLKTGKCRMFQKKYPFNGHVLSGNGIEPDPEKVYLIISWPVPKTLSEVWSFVGLAFYYRSFIKDFGSIAAPLHELSKKGERFVWNDERQRAFETLKHRLTSAPVLSEPSSDCSVRAGRRRMRCGRWCNPSPRAGRSAESNSLRQSTIRSGSA